MTAEWPSKASGNTLLLHSGAAWRIPPDTAGTGASCLLVGAPHTSLLHDWNQLCDSTGPSTSCRAHRSEHVQRSGLILMALNSPIVCNFTCWSCYFLRSFPYWELLVDHSWPRCACLGERGSTNGTGMCLQDVLSEGDRAGSKWQAMSVVQLRISSWDCTNRVQQCRDIDHQMWGMCLCAPKTVLWVSVFYLQLCKHCMSSSGKALVSISPLVWGLEADPAFKKLCRSHNFPIPVARVRRATARYWQSPTW